MVSLCVLNLLQLHSCWLLPWGYVDNHLGLRKEFPQNRCCPKIPCSYGNKPTKRESDIETEKKKRRLSWWACLWVHLTRAFFSFVVNFSSPKSAMKWKNLRGKIFQQIFKWEQTDIFKAHLFLVVLKKRGYVWTDQEHNRSFTLFLNQTHS